MVTERVRTLLTEPTDRDIVKSHPLVSFINIGQRDRKSSNMQGRIVIFSNGSYRARVMFHVL